MQIWALRQRADLVRAAGFCYNRQNRRIVVVGGMLRKSPAANSVRNQEDLQVNRLQMNQSVIELLQGDITEQVVDAIVNAANSRLMGGGGVDGAVHRQGGPEIMRETDEKYSQGCPTGSAVISGAGRLPCKHVIHAVGPVWSGGNRGEAELLAAAIKTSLQLAAEHGCQSIAFPALSCGAYGFPLDQASLMMLQSTVDFLKNDTTIGIVRFVLFDARSLEAFQNAVGLIKT